MLAVADEDAIAPVEDDVPLGPGQVAPRNVDGKPVGPANLVQDLHGHLGVDDVPVRRGQGQGALTQGLGRVRDEKLGIDAVLDSEAPANGTGPFVGIEREHPPRQAQAVRRSPQPGEEQPEIVVDLGQRSDRGPGPRRRDPLADGHGGGEAGDVADVRPPQLAHELPGVGRERLEVAPLRLPEDDVENERGFSRTRDPGDDGHPAVRDVDVDVPEVVLGRAADGQDVHGGPIIPRRLRIGQTRGLSAARADARRDTPGPPRNATGTSCSPGIPGGHFCRFPGHG